MYNAARSKVFNYFAYVLDDDYFDQTKELDLSKIKKAIYDCLRLCNTYLDISQAFIGFENEENIKPSLKNSAEKIKLFARRCLRYYNALQDFCVYSRNYAAYLLKKIFNESSKPFDVNRICHFVDELTFDNKEDVERFEKNNDIEETTDTKAIINKTLDAFYLDLDYCDESFSFWYENRVIEKKNEL